MNTYYTTIDQRIDNLRKQQEEAISSDKVIFYFPSNAREKPNIAENRTLDKELEVLLFIHNPKGAVTISSEGTTYHIQASFPFRGIYHKHEFIELFYVIDGCFEQYLLGELHHFEAGEFVITDQNCEHADYVPAEDASIVFIQIKSQYLDELLRCYDHNDTLQHFFFHALSRQKKEQSFLHLVQTGPDARLTSLHILEQLFEEGEAVDASSKDICTGLLKRLLLHLCVNYTTKLISSSLEAKEKATLYQVERYIRMNCAEVSSAGLEETFHYHRNYYNLLLKKYRGKTFKQYLLDVRLSQAHELLQNSDLSIREIARRVGYENTSHFYHMYEGRYGHGPRKVN